MDNTEIKQASRAAHRRADQLEQQLLDLYPRVWAEMDLHRTTRPMAWPDWCLLPMGSPASIAQASPVRPYLIAHLSALYAWRFGRSVWILDKALLGRLLTQVPDQITVDDLATLPEWCVYVAAAHPEYPGAGLWIHLEHDVNTGRPELRLLLDPTGEGHVSTLVPIPVYLDRDSVTEALADFRATTLAGGVGGNVRGGVLDAATAWMAELVDGYLGLAAYLARPESAAVVRCPDRPGVAPVRGRAPVRDRRTWLVGMPG